MESTISDSISTSLGSGIVNRFGIIKIGFDFFMQASCSARVSEVNRGSDFIGNDSRSSSSSVMLQPPHLATHDAVEREEEQTEESEAAVVASEYDDTPHQSTYSSIIFADTSAAVIQAARAKGQVFL